MKRKIIALGIAAVALVVVAVAAAFLLIDVNRYRGVIQTQLEQQLQRKVTLGKMALGLFPLRVQVNSPVISEDPALNSKAPFVKASRLDVRVSLMSLLRRKVQVESVDLRRPSVELVRNRQGVWNFSTIGPKPEPGGGKGGDKGGGGEPPPPALTLDRLTITDGQIAITDQQANQPRAVYDHIDFSLVGYKPGQPFDIDLSAHLPGQGAEEIRLAGTAGPIPDAGAAATPFNGKLTIREVGIEGMKQFMGSSAPMKDTSGSLSGETRISSKGGELTAAGNLTLSSLKLTGVDVGYPIVADYDMASNVASGILTIRKGNLQLGGTPLALTGSINTAATPLSVDLRVKSDDTSIADIARLLSAFGVAFAPGTDVAGKVAVDVRARGPVGTPALSGSVTGRDIVISGKDVPMPVHVKQVNVALSPTEIRANEFTATSGQTSVNARFAVQRYMSENPIVDAGVRAPSATLPELQAIARAYGVTGLDEIEGQGGLNLDMHLAGTAQSLSSADMMRAVNGAINLDFSPLKVKGFDLMKELGTIGKFAAPNTNGSLTEMVKVTGAILVKDGVASTNNLQAQLIAGNVAANGTADLATDALNMKLSAVLNKNYADKVGGTKIGGLLSTVLANPSGELVIPAVVTGTMKQPKFAPDLGAVADLQKQRLLPTLTDPRSGIGSFLCALTGPKNPPPAAVAPAAETGEAGQPAAQPAANNDAPPPKPVERITGLLGGLLGGKKPSNPLAGTSWQWEKTTGADGKTTAPRAPQKFVAQFGTDGRVSSSTDCNRLMGSYSVDGAKLSIGPLAGTKMACGESQEAEYAGALGAAASFAISGDALTITLRDSGTMTFKRQ
ncbi:MAG TPA: META domain-containing protein [Terriglobia bacterium]|nr:META domain-containing protein [Terriglobia bacterium]